MRGCIQLQWNSFEDSTCLPISWWAIYERTCLHHTGCSAIFDQKRHDLHPPPTLFTWCYPEWLFFVSLDENRLERVTVGRCGRAETKNSRSTKRHQNWRVQKLFWAAGEKVLIGASHQEDSTLKVTEVYTCKKNTQFYINKVCLLSSPFISPSPYQSKNYYN